jgi:hypothetical protein
MTLKTRSSLKTLNARPIILNVGKIESKSIIAKGVRGYLIKANLTADRMSAVIHLKT